MTSDPLPVCDLQADASGCSDVNLVFTGVSAIITYTAWTGNKSIEGCLSFGGVVAIRVRDEMRSAGFPPSSYDCVVLLDHSSWKREVQLAGPRGPEWRLDTHKHLAVLISNFGLVELICLSIKLDIVDA